MAINTTTLNAGAGGDKVLHDTLSTVNGSAAPSGAVAQVNKLAFGAPDAATLVDTSNPLPVNVASTAYRSSVSITRPANATPYTAGDVLGGVLTISAIGPTAGHVLLTSIDLRYDVAAIPSGMTSFRLYLYSATPPSAYADNAVWDLPSGDRTAYIGFVDLGSIADLGSTLFLQVDGINKQVQLGSGETALYGYLVTNGGYTPAANSETLRLVVRSVAV